MTASEILAKFKPRGVVRAGALLFDQTAALALLEEVESAGIQLCGIEGYWLHGQVIELSQENSIYFMGADMRVASLPGASPHEKARAFLLSRCSSELIFDFDLGE